MSDVGRLEYAVGDQAEGMGRDSDIKFECRLLLVAISILPEEIQSMLLPSIHNIVRLENERLDKMKGGTDAPSN